MGVVIVLAVGSAFGGLIYFAVSKIRAHAALVQRNWEAIAQRLGLAFRRGPHSDRYVHARHSMPEMYGKRDEHDVYVGIRAYTTGSGKNQQTHHWTYVDVVFDLALKRGIEAMRADGVSKFFGSLFGQLDIQTGHTHFDKEMKLKGIDEAQVRALFASDGLREVLLRNYGPARVHLTDSWVRLEVSGMHVDPTVIEPLIEPTLVLAKTVLAAWRTLPPSDEERRIAPVWGPLCTREDLRFEERGMRARGRRGNVDAVLEVVFDSKRGWVTDVSARFDPELAVGLRLAKEGALAGIGKLFGAQDIKTGDAAFDKLFVIKGKDPNLVLEILTPKARDMIRDLLESGADDLAVDDTAVRWRINRVLVNDNDLHDQLRKVCDAANEMVAHRKAPELAPYR